MGNSNQNGTSESTSTQVDKEPKLTNLDIVIFNFVPDTKLEQLKEELKRIYGDFEPLSTRTNVITAFLRSSDGISPNSLLSKNILYYDKNEQLEKPLPDKIECFEIRIITRVPGWNEVICTGKLKDKYLEIAKQEFVKTIEKKKTISLSQTIKDAHIAFETFLSDSIMDNIISESKSETRKKYLYAYVGESKQVASNDVAKIVTETKYTRGMIGWGIQHCFSCINGYLVAPHGILHIGSANERGFSLLNLNPSTRYKPDSNANKSSREFLADSYENEIINDISFLLFIESLISLRLRQIMKWEETNVESWHDVQKVTNTKNIKIALKKLRPIHNNISKYRSDFLHKSFIVKNECNNLTHALQMCSKYLSSQHPRGYPIESAFCDNYVFNDEYKKKKYECKAIEIGPFLSVIKKSEKTMELLLSETNRIDDQQQNLSAHVDSLVNISMQTKMEKMTSLMTSLTVLIFILTACTLVVTILPQVNLYFP